MEVMLSGYGASCLPPGTGDLVSRLPLRGQPAGRPWAPLLPMRKGAPANSCCWRRGAVSPADDAARRLELTQGMACAPSPLPGEGVGEDGDGSSMARGEGCPALRAPAAEGAGGGSCRGADTHTEAGGGSHDGAGPHTEGGGGSHDGAGPHTEAGDGSHDGTGPHTGAGGGSHGGAGPHTEAGGGSCHGAGPHTEAGGGSCRGAGPHTEVGGGSCHGAGPHTEAEGGSCRGAGPHTEAGGGSHDGAGPHTEAGCGSHDRAGPHTKVEDGSCHGAGPIVEAEGGPDHGAGLTAEKHVEPYHGTGQRKRSQGCGNNVGRDGAFTELPALQQQQCMHRGIQFGKESAAEKTGLPVTHRCACWEHSSPSRPVHSSPVVTPRPTGLVTMTTIVGDVPSQWQDDQVQEEAGDDFGTFEKAGNHVVWAESVCPSWLEGEELFGLSEPTVTGTQGADEGAAHHRTWRRPENCRETVWHAASLDGPSARAVGSWESKSPHLSVTLTPRGGWRPFHSTSRDSSLGACSRNERELVQVGGGEQWWSASSLEGSAFPVAAPPESSPGKKRLESVFLSCFPTVSSVRSTCDTFSTLEQILGSTGERGDEELLRELQKQTTCLPLTRLELTWLRKLTEVLQELSRSRSVHRSSPACDLWALIQDIDTAVSLKHKQTGCWSRRLLLASLRVDPGDANLPAVRATTLTSPPQPSRDKRLKSSPSPAASGRESRELSVTKQVTQHPQEVKVNRRFGPEPFVKHPFPQHQMNGFSPSHRIQAFFHQWTQAERAGRSKTPHDASRNFAD